MTEYNVVWANIGYIVSFLAGVFIGRYIWPRVKQSIGK